ncbi:MAG: chemotaxis protein CheW [Synechococcales bacterium]|nr:chemotaxis protein CheW [Synechococcales bacterium]
MKPSPSALARASDSRRKIAGESFLKFQLCPNTLAVFTMRQVLEAMTLPTRQLTPMPNTAPYMLGLMNRRSRVLWVVSLPLLLGLPLPSIPVQQYSLIIVQVNSMPLALAVHQVDGITWLDPTQIQPSLNHLSTSIVPYLSGCVFQQNTVLLVLDAAAVIKSPLLRQH